MIFNNIIATYYIIQIAFAKNEEAVKALKEARYIENEHKVKFGDPQFGILEKFNSAR